MPLRTPISARLVALAVLAVVGAATPALAQQGGGEERLRVHAYTLRYQPASEAIELVRPLLSVRGTVELQPGGNTLVIRDSLAALARIVPVLRRFDHPAQPVRVEIMVVRASTNRVSPPLPSTVPPELVARLRGLLRYETFELLAQADLQTHEGDDVTYEMGDDFAVRFRLGTLLDDRRIKLHGFQVLRAEPEAEPEDVRQLIHTNLNLWLGETVTLAPARSEDSATALMVVVTCRAALPPSAGTG
jgi:hypothetical protein